MKDSEGSDAVKEWSEAAHRVLDRLEAMLQSPPTEEKLDYDPSMSQPVLPPVKIGEIWQDNVTDSRLRIIGLAMTEKIAHYQWCDQTQHPDPPYNIGWDSLHANYRLVGYMSEPEFVGKFRGSSHDKPAVPKNPEAGQIWRHKEGKGKVVVRDCDPGGPERTRRVEISWLRPDGKQMSGPWTLSWITLRSRYEYVGIVKEEKPTEPGVGQVWEMEPGAEGLKGWRAHIDEIRGKQPGLYVYLVDTTGHREQMHFGWLRKNARYIGMSPKDEHTEIPGTEAPFLYPKGWFHHSEPPPGAHPRGTVLRSRRTGKMVKVVTWAECSDTNTPDWVRAVIQNIVPGKGQRKKTRLVRARTLRSDYRRAE